MKAIILLLCISLTSAAQNLVMIKGHLYDFGAALMYGPQSAYSNFWISGKVAEVFPKCLILQQQTGNAMVLNKRLLQSKMRYASAGEMLQCLAAAQLAEKSPKGLSAGEYYSLDSSLREMFTEQPIYLRTIVFNYPDGTRAGMNLQICGAACGKGSLAHIANATDLPTFDCGSPFAGATNSGYYLATTKGFLLITNQPAKTNLPALPSPVQLTNRIFEPRPDNAAQDDPPAADIPELGLKKEDVENIRAWLAAGCPRYWKGEDMGVMEKAK